jgi:hypothetical protein
VRRTLAPAASAISAVRSLELSMIKISPGMSTLPSPSRHQAMKSAIVSCSFKAGTTIDSTGASTSCSGTSKWVSMGAPAARSPPDTASRPALIAAVTCAPI